MPIIIDTTDTLPYDYPTLVSMVAQWMARMDSKFTGNVANFIRLAEERIWRTLRTDKMLSPLAITVTAGGSVAPLPTDFLAFKTVKVPKPSGEMGGITYVSPESMDDLSAQGDRRLYTIVGQNFVYGQAQTADLAVTGYYYARPPMLAASQTNWLIIDNPSVYLYGALLEGAVFVKNSARAGEYGTLFDRAIEAIKSTDKVAALGAGRLIQTRVGGYVSTRGGA